MNYPAKVSVALERLAATRLQQHSYAPPFHRFLWSHGISVPPPHFAGFLFNFALTGGFFGVGWGAFMGVYFWLRYGAPLLQVVPYALGAGVAFGALMALYYRHGARKHKLPSWSSLSDVEATTKGREPLS